MIGFDGEDPSAQDGAPHVRKKRRRQAEHSATTSPKVVMTADNRAAIRRVVAKRFPLI
jgi:hypothetical protein